MDIDVWGELANHQAEGDVAVVVEMYWEGYRYLEGVALAINGKEESKSVELVSIMDSAKTLGEHVPPCEY